METYTQSGGRGRATFNQADAVAVMLEKYEICCDMLHGFDWTSWSTATPQETLSIIAGAQEHILAQDGGKERFLQAVLDLSRAFALSVPDDEAIRIRNDVRFFQTLRAALLKKSAGDQTPSGDLDSAIRQIVPGPSHRKESWTSSPKPG